MSVNGGVTLLFVKRCVDRGGDKHPASRSMASLCNCSEGRLQMRCAFFGLFHESGGASEVQEKNEGGGRGGFFLLTVHAARLKLRMTRSK